ncbi:MAG: GntR family transcriptional regulator [Acidimicrobiia bacterium]|nr:GntR family transcriptional regulator [Acidimicrobiia bacterium]
MAIAKHRTKVDLVEREILRKIERGELTPGTVLQQRDLARQLDVSPTPVREAFRRLEMAGILHSNAHGVEVAERVTADDETTRRVLAVLEGLGVELILERATPDDLAVLRARNERYRTGSIEECHEAHWQLHLGMFEIARSTVLTNHLRLLWSLVDTASSARRSREESAAHHTAILDALASHDAELAKRLMREHHSHKPALD